jgi:hypothetical protein
MSSDPIPIDRKRRREASMLSDLMDAAPKHVPALDDDAGWAEHDQRLREEAAKVDHRGHQRALEKRGSFLKAKKWPAVRVDAALALAEVDGAMLRRVGHFLRGQGRPMSDGKARRLLVVSSGVGSGKTTAACWWALRREDSRPVFLRAAAIAACSRYDKDFRRSWEEASSLVVDDLGREFADGKGSLLTDLEEIVDHCDSNAIPLVMTTNTKPDAFWERYGGKDGPIASRLRGAGAWFSSSEPDRRKP